MHEKVDHQNYLQDLKHLEIYLYLPYLSPSLEKLTVTTVYKDKLRRSVNIVHVVHIPLIHRFIDRNEPLFISSTKLGLRNSWPIG